MEFQDVWKFDTISPKCAAALIVNYGVPLLGLFRRAKIKNKAIVLITVDHGGLGLAALDIAANVYKAKVNCCLHMLLFKKYQSVEHNFYVHLKKFCHQ